MIAARGLRGACTWSLDLDDFNTICPDTNENYPVLSYVVKELERHAGDTTTTGSTTTSRTTTTGTGTSRTTTTGTTTPTSTTQSTTRTTTPSTTPGTGCTDLNPNCIRDGNIRDLTDCRYYITCVFTGTVHATYYRRICPAGLVFDERIMGCTWPYNVDTNALCRCGEPI